MAESNVRSWIFGTPKDSRIVATPLFESEEGLYSLFDKLMRYDEETGNTGEISVYAFFTLCKSRTPYNCQEYKYNVILSTCSVSKVDLDGEHWWARFKIVKRRESWDVFEIKHPSNFYEA